MTLAVAAFRAPTPALTRRETRQPPPIRTAKPLAEIHRLTQCARHGESQNSFARIPLSFHCLVRRQQPYSEYHEAHRRLLFDQAGISPLAALQHDEDSQCGCSGTDQKRDSRRKALAASTQQRQYAPQ